jgi:carbon storage regulator
MLILSRKPGESIVIDGRITVKIMRLEGDMVKLGIEAPIHVPVHRQEVYDEIQKNNQEALNQTVAKLPQLTAKSKPMSPKAASTTKTKTPLPYANQR